MFIGAHNRQQAMGNMLGSLFGGGTTVLRKQILVNNRVITNPSWDFLKKYDFEITEYQALKKSKTVKELITLSADQAQKHQQIILDEFSLEHRSGQLQKACDQILDSIRSLQIPDLVNV